MAKYDYEPWQDEVEYVFELIDHYTAKIERLKAALRAAGVPAAMVDKIAEGE